MLDVTFQALNRIFKNLGKIQPCETHAEALATLETLAENDPEKLATQIDFLIEKSIHAYEYASDGRHPENYRIRAEKRYQAFSDRVVEIVGLLGIEVNWPGLYPAYRKDGYTEHTTLSALNYLL